jgi:hypothetical protein
MVHCIDGMHGFVTLHDGMHGFITLHVLLKTFYAIESAVRKVEMVYIQEECVVYVQRTQTAAVILNYIIDHEDILEDHGAQLLCCKHLKTSKPHLLIPPFCHLHFSHRLFASNPFNLVC